MPLDPRSYAPEYWVNQINVLIRNGSQPCVIKQNHGVSTPIFWAVGAVYVWLGRLASGTTGLPTSP